MKASVYVAVAAIAAAAGFAAYWYFLMPRATMETTAGPIEVRQIAPEPAAADDALPTTLPDFTLGDLSGTPRSIRSWPGKSMIVNFWATWCAPCRREIPLLRELQKQHGAAGFPDRK